MSALHVVHMVDRVAQVIGQDFLNLEFIPPYLEFSGANIAQGSVFLIGKDPVGGHLPGDQFSQIKPDHLHGIVAELQLIEREELADQRIHFLRFIHDHAQIVVPGFRVIRDRILQALRVPLDQGEGRLELMRHIGQEFPAHVVCPGPLLQALLQFIVRGLELGDRTLQRLTHPVEMLSQLPDLILAAAGILRIEIQVRHPL